MTRKRKRILSVLFIVALIALAWQYFSSNLAAFKIKPITPEPPVAVVDSSSNLTLLDSLSQLQAQFQSDDGKVRVVAILSPTWLISQRGFNSMLQLRKNLPDPALQIYILWMPIMPEDNYEKAAVLAENAAEIDGFVQFWDDGQLSGQLWQQTLLLNQTAWDVYLLYGKDRVWDAEPGVPDFWMRQLKGVVEAPLYDADAFSENVRILLDGGLLN